MLAGSVVSSGIMIEAALSVLLADFRTSPSRPQPRQSSWWDPKVFVQDLLRPEIVKCRSVPKAMPMTPLEEKFAFKFRNDRFKVHEALGQIVSQSPSRVQWEAKAGANVIQMVIAALSQLPSGQVVCTIKSRDSIAFSIPSHGITVDVALQREGALFTAFSERADAEEVLMNAAVESVAADVSNNVRSYSYSSSWSSGGDERIFDPHNPFGEMESMLHRFFEIPGSVQPGVGSMDRFDNRRSSDFPKHERLVGGDRVSQELEGMGVQVIMPQAGIAGTERVDWSSLAGYEKVKSQVEESVILGLKHPSLFERIIEKTRGVSKSATNRPKVVLFEGPPGTGKSSTARIIANETNVPMIHIPLESVVSKWFGESEKQIAKIYELARELANNVGAKSVILFIDEIDSLVSSRDIGTPHEASKRILSVMLRQIDGFNSENGPQSTLICATNRKKDLDKAFLSRVDSSIHFGLPCEDSRIKILKLYAKHLSDDELRQLASITDGLSGRNLKDLCQSAERHWAATVIRGLGRDVRDDDVEISPPPVNTYIEAAKEKFSQQIQ